MNRVRTGYVALAATAVAILLSAGLPGTAWADDDPVAEILKAAETVAVGDATPADAEVPVPRVDGDAVTVDLDASDLEVTLGNSAEATISESGQYAIVEDASVTYAVSHPAEGITRLAAILAAPIDEHPRWTFESGTQLLLLDDGSVSVSNGEEFLGGIDAPWAVDADGNSLPTHYEISDTTLTQFVDTTEAKFPV